MVAKRRETSLIQIKLLENRKGVGGEVLVDVSSWSYWNKTGIHCPGPYVFTIPFLMCNLWRFMLCNCPGTGCLLRSPSPSVPSSYSNVCVILCPRLTAFVMKSFGRAMPYIFKSSKQIVSSRTWLLTHRQPDGCIRSVGKLFHNGMKVTWISPKQPYCSKCIQDQQLLPSDMLDGCDTGTCPPSLGKIGFGDLLSLPTHTH